MGIPKGLKRDFDALAKRRFQAIRLLDQGLNQSETTRRLNVSWQTVREWRRQYQQQGVAALRCAACNAIRARSRPSGNSLLFVLIDGYYA